MVYSSEMLTGLQIWQFALQELEDVRSIKYIFGCNINISMGSLHLQQDKRPFVKHLYHLMWFTITYYYQLVLNILMALKACASILLGIPVSRIPRFPVQRSLLRLTLSTWRLVVFLFASSCILGWSWWSLTQTTNRTICYNLISHNKNIQEQEQFNVAAWLWHVWSCER